MPSWSNYEIVAILCIYVVGFFATAGAAGADIASNSRNTKDVHLGGLMGIFLPTVLAGGAAMLIIAGAYGGGMIRAEHIGNYNPVYLMSDIFSDRFGGAVWPNIANIAMIALAISALPGGVFLVVDRRQQL